ncbi:SGNH/GDSL hydrolase family protein [Streptomyces scabiei]|uniref:SGNH/GDSL hydrolase family protein n=1 Tax=Streptomyces scabiei TaxID=1930 RepID=UPI0029B3CB4C|nr:SGNH/GDSL hydrolase family protein [Streptomyces scabiei]MDX3277321.1 SGNH/GDSL hydrolase family protein [Streptomyces scabiei]
MLASLVMFVSPGTAAADTFPTLRHPAVKVNPGYASIVSNPSGNGEVTVGCNPSAQDLTTYNASGTVVRQISRTSQIDGVQNCIQYPAVAKSGHVYGVPWGQTSSGSWTFGANLLAYNGNTLKWKYPVNCGSDAGAQYVVGADGNIYVTTYTPAGGGVHLIGLKPDLTTGQTQPAKVLDIQVPGDCTMKMYAFKDGVVLHGQSGNPRYYSYGGTPLGEAPFGDVWNEKINAVGVLFKYKYVSGSFTSASISAYEPMTRQTLWTTSASTSGANVNEVSMSPLPGGGVAALIQEDKMVAGAPAVPAESVWTLVTLNSTGQKVRAVTLPNKDAQGNQFDAPKMVTDSSGSIVLVRQLNVTTGVGYPSTVPEIQVSAINVGTGAVTYTGKISGAITAQTQSGYSLSYAGENGPVIGADTLYLVAKCRWSCVDSDLRLYPISVAGLGKDYPRGALLNGPKPESYVALGDSYSSGEGVPPFDASTDTSTNKCHRSIYAYSRLVSQDIDLAATVGVEGVKACSGAKTKHITGQWVVGDSDTGVNLNEAPQINALSSSTKFVSLNIGGNDIGFGDFGTACFDNTCAIGSTAYNTALGKINNELPAKLTATYQAILSAAPNAKVYVLGYPQVAPVKSPGQANDIRCGYLNDGLNSWGDAQAARDIVTRINSKIDTAISAIGDPDLRYVNVNGTNSPFAGHTVCSDPGDSYFMNIDQVINDRNYIFHPNYNGSVAYAKVLLDAMKQ